MFRSTVYLGTVARSCKSFGRRSGFATCLCNQETSRIVCVRVYAIIWTTSYFYLRAFVPIDYTAISRRVILDVLGSTHWYFVHCLFGSRNAIHFHITTGYQFGRGSAAGYKFRTSSVLYNTSSSIFAKDRSIASSSILAKNISIA